MKKQNGITLIALVITIIVLLILAGVVIASLTGENGLLERAASTKDVSKAAQEKEQIRMAVIASYKEDGRVDRELLAENLNKIDGLTDHNGGIITSSTKKVKYTATGNEYTIDANGNIKEKQLYDEIEMNDVILGTEVSNYDVNGTWKVFYCGEVGNNDNPRIYLIKTNNSSDEISINEFINRGYTYNGTSDFDGSPDFKQKFPAIEQGLFYKTYKNNEVLYSSDLENMKFTEYLLDSSLETWKNYMDKQDKSGFAEYAIGAPTLELFLESYNTTKSSGEKISFSNTTPSGNGYAHTIEDSFQIDSIWNFSKCWIAGPHEDFKTYVLSGSLNTPIRVANNTSNNAMFGCHPIVCMNSNVKLGQDKNDSGKYVLFFD